MSVNGAHNPVNTGVVSDGVMGDVNTYDFIVLVGSVLSSPVGVQNSETSNGKFKLKKYPIFLPTRSSATDLRLRWNLS